MKHQGKRDENCRFLWGWGRNICLKYKTIWRGY